MYINMYIYYIHTYYLYTIKQKISPISPESTGFAFLIMKLNFKNKIKRNIINIAAVN